METTQEQEKHEVQSERSHPAGGLSCFQQCDPLSYHPGPHTYQIQIVLSGNIDKPSPFLSFKQVEQVIHCILVNPLLF